MAHLYDYSYPTELSGLGDQHPAAVDEVVIALNSTSIRRDFERVGDEKERESLKRRLSGMVDYARWHHGSGDLVFDSKMDRLSDLIVTLSVSKYKPCVPKPSLGQSLQTTVNEIISEQRFAVLGPELQKVGKAAGDCRFVCIFCHEVKVKTGDLRVHLVKKHDCDGSEVKQIFDRSKPQGIRVFGQYSYADVCDNGWDIKDWTQRKQRSESTIDNKRRKDNQHKSSRKRPPNPRASSSKHQPQAVPMETFEQQTSLSIGLTRGTTTKSPYSPFTQIASVEENIATPCIAGDSGDFEMLEGLSSSMENSTDDLAQIGTKFPANNWRVSDAMSDNSSDKPVRSQLSGYYTMPSVLDQYIDPKVLMPSIQFAPLRSAQSFSPRDILLTGSSQQANRDHKT